MQPGKYNSCKSQNIIEKIMMIVITASCGGEWPASLLAALLP
jgi:hypothetical protein